MKNPSPRFFAAIAVCLLAAPLSAQPAPAPTEIKLTEDDRSWRLSRGDEFPGAKGRVEPKPDGDKWVAALHYDLTEGGRYVAAFAHVRIEDGVRELRLKVRSDAQRQLTLRLIDATGQAHQVGAAYSDAGKWQELRVSLAGFKAPLHWGGAKDGRLHFPLKTIWVCAGHPSRDQQGMVEIGDLIGLY